MSEFTDDTLGRYLDQQPGMRQALLTDPVQKMQAEALRQTLSMVERALTDEGVPDDVRRRVINRVVWGEPEGFVDVHAQMEGVRRQMLAADLPPDLAKMWQDFPSAVPERPVSGEETNG
ncbi:hypothetical protein P1S61_37540 [Streptomyces sp. ME08-AFT2]|uniref:hypothetical protein n=1 Tax=Streptomyces sp. ME08-AFT2 TaxID=3028683 RepID=UPI0029A3CF56|nr:hypothetical protein [Streptomyces sp. ME08-AFT2]MDX3314661.1 hypothetical protein [Streptomyces sp. ME08-AFT2]